MEVNFLRAQGVPSAKDSLQNSFLKYALCGCLERMESYAAEVIIPKLAKKFWQGHERLLFDYVYHGGQLYVIGGQTPR